MANGVGGVGNTQNYYNQYNAANKTEKEDQPEQAAANPVDTYTPSKVKPKDPATVKQLWNETNQAAETLKKMVSKLLGKSDAEGQGFWAVRAGGSFKLDDADRAQAQEMIGEDGFFGVKQTTDRIMNFAKALVGEGASEEKIEEMRAAVQKGFDEAGKMFGGYNNLPDVSKKTYEAVMKSFDDWKAGNTAA